MKLIITHAQAARPEKFVRWFEDSILSLQPLLDIEEAHLTIDYDDTASPPYTAKAHLKVPGPDLKASAVDHTVRTAFERLMKLLRAGAIRRAERRVRRRNWKRVLPVYQVARSGHA